MISKISIQNILFSYKFYRIKCNSKYKINIKIFIIGFTKYTIIIFIKKIRIIEINIGLIFNIGFKYIETILYNTIFS